MQNKIFAKIHTVIVGSREQDFFMPNLKNLCDLVPFLIALQVSPVPPIARWRVMNYGYLRNGSETYCTLFPVIYSIVIDCRSLSLTLSSLFDFWNTVIHWLLFIDYTESHLEQQSKLFLLTYCWLTELWGTPLKVPPRSWRSIIKWIPSTELGLTSTKDKTHYTMMTGHLCVWYLKMV